MEQWIFPSTQWCVTALAKLRWTWIWKLSISLSRPWTLHSRPFLCCYTMLNSLGAWCCAWLICNQAVAICTQGAAFHLELSAWAQELFAGDAGFVFEKWNINFLKLVQWITVTNANNFLCITPITEFTFESVSSPPWSIHFDVKLILWLWGQIFDNFLKHMKKINRSSKRQKEYNKICPVIYYTFESISCVSSWFWCWTNIPVAIFLPCFLKARLLNIFSAPFEVNCSFCIVA